VALEVSEELAGLEVLAEREVLAVSAELGATDGNTTRHIGAALRMGIATRQIALAARPVATRWLTARRAHGIRSGVRAAIWAATTAAEPAESEIAAELEGLVELAESEIAAELEGLAELAESEIAAELEGPAELEE
jgi:hypothetical protein